MIRSAPSTFGNGAAGFGSRPAPSGALPFPSGVFPPPSGGLPRQLPARGIHPERSGGFSRALERIRNGADSFGNAPRNPGAKGNSIAASRLLIPEGSWKLAGGASHRTRGKTGFRPGRGGGGASRRFPAPLPGRNRSPPTSGGSRHRLISLIPPGWPEAASARPRHLRTARRRPRRRHRRLSIPRPSRPGSRRGSATAAG